MVVDGRVGIEMPTPSLGAEEMRHSDVVVGVSASPFVVLIVLAGGDARDLASTSLTRAAHQALDDDATVVVREASATLDDQEASAIADSAHADAVVVVRWASAEHGEALVHARPRPGAPWVDRAITFAPQDPQAERGRTVGFEIASLVPHSRAEPSASDGTSGRAARALSAPAPAPAPPAPASASASASALPASTLPAPALQPALRAPPPPTLEGPFAVDLLGAFIVGSNATSGGGDVAARARIVSRLFVRVVGGARFGAIDDVGSTLTLRGGGGPGVVLLHPSLPIGAGAFGDAFALAARADLLASRLEVRHGGEQASRWIPTADVVLEAGLQLAPRWQVFLDGGVEVALGRTNVFIDGTEVAEVRPLRAIFDLGVRFSP